METEVETEMVMEMEMEMEIEVETEMEMEIEMGMEMEMVEMVILMLRRRVGSSDLHSKRLVALNFEALEVVGASKSDQESPKKLPKRP